MINLLNLGTITSKYGDRNSPTAGASSNHKGVDIVLKDYNIPAVVSGKVVDSGYNSSMGNYVKIVDENGYTTVYMHMAKTNVKKGDSVKEGFKIGVMGSTGISTGDHLHFQVERGGKTINPEDFFKGNNSKNAINSGNDWKSTSTTLVGSLLSVLVVIVCIILGFILFSKAFDIKF